MSRVTTTFALLSIASLFGLADCGTDTNAANATCSDGLFNGNETDVDCGGPSCDGCATGQVCGGDTDCASAWCNGGQCAELECDSPDTCPGTNGECQTRTCDDHLCGIDYASNAVAIAAQTAGDCQKVVCNGAGGTTSVADDADLPVDDNVCTADVCTTGAPSNPPVNANTACGTDLVCDGAGSCVGCVDFTTCPGTDTECQQRTCDGQVCGMSYADDTVAIADQTAGDCHKVVCNNAGGTQSVIDDTDEPNDDNDCTDDVCTAGVGSNPPFDPNTPCGDGLVCDGDGHCVGCFGFTTCPGTDGECQQRTCIDETCGMEYFDGTPIAQQTAGDCLEVVCNDAGGTRSIDDDFDPFVDGNPCTKDICTAGVASNPPILLGQAPGCAAPLYCDGDGHCVECMSSTECTGTDNECQHRTCIDGACGMALVVNGDPATVQVPGDCHTIRCDGTGAVLDVVVNDSDPFVDGDLCTQDICTAGTPSNPLQDPGFHCATGVCDATGACVECLVQDDCVKPLTKCATVDCNTSTNLCETTYVPENTPIAKQTVGDCHEVQCTGADSTKDVIDDNDKPVDLDPCTQNVCTAGVPSNPLALEGTTCGDSQACSATGICTATFMVVRVGDGAVSLSSVSTAVFVEERWIDGSLVAATGNPIALPIAVSGDNQILTLGGTTTTEGALARSTDGSYVVLGGYAAMLGTASGAESGASTVNRIVARIDSAYNVDTTTRINNGFNGTTGTPGNVRGVCSTNGTDLWVSGTSKSDQSGGVHYVTYGSTGASVDLYSTPNNTRVCNVFDGQLYASSGASGYTFVFTVGSGLPTGGTPAVTLLPNSAVTSTPQGFVMFDRNPAVAGVDTLFVADNSASAGVVRWTFDGAIWTKDATSVATGASYGLTGFATTTGVTLFVNGTGTVSRIDVPDIGSPVVTSIATAGTNRAFRGVALSPRHL